MCQKKCSHKMIYEIPAFNFSNLEQGKYISKVIKKSEIKLNLIYSYNQLKWQGPLYVRDLFKKIQNKNIFFHVDCKNNYGSVLQVMRTEISNIIFSSNDQIIDSKIMSLSEQYSSKIFSLKKFKKFYLINETNDIKFFMKEFNPHLEKIKFFK